MFNRPERFSQAVLSRMASGNATFIAIADHIAAKAGFPRFFGPDDMPVVSVLKLVGRYGFGPFG